MELQVTDGNFEQWLQTPSGKARTWGHWDFQDFDDDLYGCVVGFLCRMMQITKRCPHRVRHPKGAPPFDYALPLKDTETSALWMIDDLFVTVEWGGSALAVRFVHDPITPMKPEAERVLREIQEILAECGSTVH
jgi:hypothetical protein